MELSNELKIEFLKYLLIGRIGDLNVEDNWFKNGIFPDEEFIINVINTPIDDIRLEGLDWPKDAITMIGLKRINNLHKMLDYVRENNIEGDLIETGVWRGGSVIFMKLYCQIYNIDKKVFVCDSFEGLPKPSGRFDQDDGDTHYQHNELAISLEEVKNNFRKYKCLDDKVLFIKGFFSETLPNNGLIEKLCILRMDGDMYESTYDVFYSCYDKLVKNGVCIIDDYCLSGARLCTEDFRKSKGINDPINVIDKCGIFWIKN